MEANAKDGQRDAMAIITDEGEVCRLYECQGRFAAPQRGCWNLYTPDFLLKDEEPWWSFAKSEKLNPDPLSEGVTPLPLMVPPSRGDFEKKFREIKGAFETGVLSKAVPVVFERGKLKVSRDIFLSWARRAIAHRHPNVFPYGLWSQGEGILGASPEILVCLNSSSLLRTMALAGTHASEKGGDVLLSDEKELYEHRLVIEDICQRLEGLGAIEKGITHILSVPGLSHLCTWISVKGTCSLLEAVSCLHPTSALGVLPKEQTSWLPGLLVGGKERGRFGAPFGWLSPEGRGLCLVAIRNIQWRGEEIQLASGCGIVPASNIDREWKELHAKRDSVRRSLRL